jgi:Tfp pilus assembly protein PilN
MKTMVNLLPVAYRRQQIIRRRVVQWATIAFAVIFVGYGWHAYELREALALSHQLETLEREHAPNKTMLKQLVEMREKLNDLQQQEKVAKELEFRRNVLALLGVISETAQSTNGRVRVTELQLSGFQDLRDMTSPSAGDEGPRGLTVRGVSLDNPSVGEMLDGLQDSGMFRRVELLVLKERPEGDISLRDYEVRCEF